MIIYEGPGDLFQCGMQTILCPINVVGVMGKGLAKQFKERVPGLFDFYRGRYGTSPDDIERRLFQLEVFSLSASKKVLLFPTKGDWRKPAIPLAIRANLITLVEHYETMGITSLGVPKLGCGEDTGQLDWDKEIGPMVRGCFDSVPLPVKVVLG